jgi:hypothetical protein
MALETRNLEARRDVYVEVLKYYGRVRLFVARTEPLMKVEGTREPPHLPDDEEGGLELEARVQALGSSEVNDAVEKCHVAYMRWEKRTRRKPSRSGSRRPPTLSPTAGCEGA